MILTQVLEAARIYNMGYYSKTVDVDDERNPALEPGAPSDAFAKSVTSANRIRREAIEAVVNGKPAKTDGLSDWAKCQLVFWERDARRIIALSAKAEPKNKTRVTRFDGNDSLGIYTKEGSVAIECENGVVVEWDGYGNDSGYSDGYKTLALYKPGSNKGELLPGPWGETYAIIADSQGNGGAI